MSEMCMINQMHGPGKRRSLARTVPVYKSALGENYMVNTLLYHWYLNLSVKVIFPCRFFKTALCSH